MVDEGNKELKRKIQIGLIVTLAAIAAWGQQSRVYREGNQWVEEVTGTLPASHNLKLITDMGSAHIRGGQNIANANAITYTIKKRVSASSEQEARREFEQIRISASSYGDAAMIRGQASSYSRGRHFSADFDIQSPRDMALINAHTGGGSLEVKSINGRVEVQTGGGNLQLDDINGGIEAQTGGGNVEVGNAGADVHVETGGGGIHVGSAKGVIQASSGGGPIRIDSGEQRMELNTGGSDIHVTTCGGDLKAQTGGGNITIGSVNGQAYLETGGGSIRLGSANGPVRASTGGGSVELYKMSHGAHVETGAGGITAEFIGTGPNFSDSRLETAAGDIRVYLPANLPVTVQAAIDVANGHSIRTDFSEFKITSEGQDYGPKEQYCEGKLNGGGPTLHVHTTVGNIDLLKRTLSASNENPR